jgi:hypothetical protein
MSPKSALIFNADFTGIEIEHYGNAIGIAEHRLPSNPICNKTYYQGNSQRYRHPAGIW